MNRIIESAAEVLSLDWEVPNAILELDEEESFSEEREKIEKVQQAFEEYNEVVLEGDAESFFQEKAKEYYSLKF